MTREEAIDWLARVKSNTVNHTLEMPLWWNESLAEALDMAIEALEQEPILDKIRAEIMSLERFEIRGEKTPLINGDNVLHIIDKYKTESEASECR